MPATVQQKTVEDFLPQLQKALDYVGTHDVHDLAASIRYGEAQLWVEDDAMIVTQVDQKPQAKHLIFWIACGDLDDVLALASRIYEWGRGIGCDKATMVGRKGWAKPLAEHGWAPPDKLILLEKDLG